MANGDGRTGGRPLILNPHWSRRQFLKEAVTATAFFSVPVLASGCRTTASSAALKDATLAPSPGVGTPAVADWVAALDPIQLVAGPATAFLGDNPTEAHPILRDDVPVPEAGSPEATPTEHAGVVIVGGGISGLAMAYLLRDLGQKPILLEQAHTLGGNAKGESWEGIDYAIGAAYLVKPEEGEMLDKAFYAPLGLKDLWREASGDPVEYLGKVLKHEAFWQGATTADGGGGIDPAKTASFRKVHDYFEDVLKNHFPDIPNLKTNDVSDDVKTLDKTSFSAHLKATLGADLHPHIETMIEHYCWSSFGGSAAELSAAAGLNFFAGEFAGVCPLPGGNAGVARQMLRQLSAVYPKENFRVRNTVTHVETKGDSVEVFVTRADGSRYTIAANAVVMACPKFIAQHVVEGASESQLAAMANLVYRSYLVGNVLLDAPLAPDFYDLYLLGKGQTTGAAKADAIAQKVTDTVVGHYAHPGNPGKSVLTLYRGFPYDGARSGLLKTTAFAQYQKEFKDQLPAILGSLGVNPSAIREVRVARWGHPLVLAQTGLLDQNVPQAASAPIGERIFFCNQDNWALPAIETCLSVALAVAPEVRKVLA